MHTLTHTSEDRAVLAAIGPTSTQYGVWSKQRQDWDWYADFAHATLVARGRGQQVWKVVAFFESEEILEVLEPVA